jgi:hypothetical protein
MSPSGVNVSWRPEVLLVLGSVDPVSDDAENDAQVEGAEGATPSAILKTQSRSCTLAAFEAL